MGEGDVCFLFVTSLFCFVFLLQVFYISKISIQSIIVVRK